NDSEYGVHEEQQSSARASFSLIQSSRDVLQSLDISFEASAKVLIIEGEATGSFEEVNNSSGRKFILRYRKNVVLKSKTVYNADLTRDAKQLTNSNEVLRMLGGYYIHKILYGAILEIDFIYDSDSVYQKE
ncbi:unnamed protein product, partial [Choristocarpus tenellus]